MPFCISMSVHRVYHYFKLTIFNGFIITFYVSISEGFQFFTIRYGPEMYMLITWFLGFDQCDWQDTQTPLEEGSQKTLQISHRWSLSTASPHKNQASSKNIIHQNAASREYCFLSFFKIYPVNLTWPII